MDFYCKIKVQIYVRDQDIQCENTQVPVLLLLIYWSYSMWFPFKLQIGLELNS